MHDARNLTSRALDSAGVRHQRTETPGTNLPRAKTDSRVGNAGFALVIESSERTMFLEKDTIWLLLAGFSVCSQVRLTI
jgi:hypothetical protein